MPIQNPISKLPPESAAGRTGRIALPSRFATMLLLWCAVSLPLFSWLLLARHYWESAVIGCFMVICLIFVWNLFTYQRHLLESNRLLLLETELSGLMYRSIKIANAASIFEEATADVCDEICQTTHWQLANKPITTSPGARLSSEIDKNLPYHVEFSGSGSELKFQILTSTVVIAEMTFVTLGKTEARVISAVKVIFSQLA